MDATPFFTGAVQILIVLLAISAHEAAHAFAARRLGDPTAAMLGRASFNPLRHIDPIGTVMVPLVLVLLGLPVFGWGRPTPVLVQNFARPRRDDLLVTAAGAAANSFLAVAATIVLPIVLAALGPQARQASELTILGNFQQAGALAGFPVVFTILQIALINAYLVFFNLIPLPPFDGGQIVLLLLPADWAEKWERLKPYGFLVGIFLGVCGVLNLLMFPLTLILSLVIQL